MLKILVLAVALSACVTDAEKTSCVQQAEAACDISDAECYSAIVDDCAPPECNAPKGQHCVTADRR